jgi:hypothetical protein
LVATPLVPPAGLIDVTVSGPFVVGVAGAGAFVLTVDCCCAAAGLPAGAALCGVLAPHAVRMATRPTAPTAPNTADLAEVVRDRFVCPGEVICVIANSFEHGPMPAL